MLRRRRLQPVGISMQTKQFHRSSVFRSRQLRLRQMRMRASIRSVRGNRHFFAAVNNLVLNFRFNIVRLLAGNFVNGELKHQQLVKYRQTKIMF